MLKYFSIFLTIALFFTVKGQTKENLTNELAISFASLQETKEILSTNDDFIKKLGPLELQARMRSTEKVNVAQYLDFLQDQALEWSNAEKKSVNDLFLSIKNRLKTLNLKLDLPEKINLVKTNGFEEPRTAYTRGQSIILPPFLVNKTKNNPIGAEFLLVHELFHIMGKFVQFS